MDIQKEREAFEAWLKSLNENGRTTYFLGQESTVAWEAWQAAKAQAVPEATCSIRAHELIIDETKKCLIDGYDIVEDEYLLESLVYRGVCIGKAQAVSEGFVLVKDNPVAYMVQNKFWKGEFEVKLLSEMPEPEFEGDSYDIEIPLYAIEAQEPAND